MTITDLRAFLERRWAGNSLEEWLIFAGIVLGVFAVLLALRGLLLGRLERLAARTEYTWDDVAVDVLRRTTALFRLFVAFTIAAQTLELTARVERWLGIFAIVALLLQFGIWGNAIVGGYVRRWIRRHGTTEAESIAMVRAIGFGVRLVVWTVVFLLVLDNVGLDITALVAGLGIGGIAIALAVQTVLGDALAALSIVLDKPFTVGDFIVVGSELGTVEHVGLKTTRVRSLSGEQLIFSNTDLLGSRIRNFKRMIERRVVMTIGVIYGTPADKIERIPQMLRAIVEAQDGVRFDRSHFKGYGDWSLNFETVYWILSPDYNTYMDRQQAINLAVYRRFEAEEIQFAFPTRTLHLTGRVGADFPVPSPEDQRV